MEQFTALLRQLRLKGIRHIGGDVVLDRSAFAVPGEDPASFDNKPLRPYNAGPDALLVNFKALTLNLSATDGRVRVAPARRPDLTIDNQLKATNGDCGSDWKDFVIIRPASTAAGNGWSFPAHTPKPVVKSTYRFRPSQPTFRSPACSGLCGRSRAAPWPARCAPARRPPRPSSSPARILRPWPSSSGISTNSPIMSWPGGSF